MSNTKLSSYAFILSLGAFALTAFAQPASAQQSVPTVEIQAEVEAEAEAATEAEVCVDETLLEEVGGSEVAAANFQCQIQCQRTYSCQWWDQGCWNALHACLAACN